jgi:hypothetical protein
VAPVTETGSIRVTVTTTGEAGNLDGDGFIVLVDAMAPRVIGTQGTMNFLDLSAGSHAVQLDGVAENCAIGGENPRYATVVADEVVEVAFTITCAPATGTLQVKTFHEGGTDPDGYTISLDGGASQPIGIRDSLTFIVNSGRHEVLLGGLAPSCTPHAENPRTIHVRPNGRSGVNFHVVCPT